MSGGSFEPLNEFEQFAEARRLDSNGLLWQVPGLSLTAQAFLVGASLAADAPRGLRVAVAALAAILALATIQLLLRHRYRERLFSNGMDASREARGLPAIDAPDVFERIADERPGDRGAAFRRWRGSNRHPQRWAAFTTWTVVLACFVLLDIGVAVAALTEG